LQQAVCLDEPDVEATSLLGKTLALVTSAVSQVIQPAKIYCLQLREEASRLHFHIFPRTEEITGVYLRGTPLKESPLIHGSGLSD